MNRRLWKLTAAIGVLSATTSFADSGVRDGAGMFSAETTKAAEAKLRQLADARQGAVLIETFAGIPEAKLREYERLGAKNRDQFFKTWSDENAAAKRADFYVLICKNPGKLQYSVKRGRFDRAAARSAADAMLAKMKTKDFDAALNAGVASLVGNVAARPTPTGAGGRPVGEGGGDVLSMVLTLGAIALLVWLAIGLFRAMSGGMGGGFFPSLLGGLFGGMMGMWMYNSFFGGHSNWGDTSGSDGGYDSGGGDWGDSGGGDFGGGGDF
jgi:uncharacterized protein